MKIHLRSSDDNSYAVIFVDKTSEIIRDIMFHFNRPSIFILTDTNVARYHARKIFSALRGKHDHCHLVVIPAGEKSKSRYVKETIEDFMIKRHVSRDSLLVTVGGGMIGDIGGFTAATMLRGIDYIQIPTTLLAQVDSSIGGKVAVNHPFGKNLLGTFYQPRMVYIHIRMLQTLPDEEYINGLAEVIKYAAILDEKFFTYLERKRDEVIARNLAVLSFIVRRCCYLKKAIIEADEKEHGLRRVLNFGHTVGHAVEQLSGYRLRHGEAISIGMVKEAQLSVQLGLLKPAEFERFNSLIKFYQLPTDVPRDMEPGNLLRLTQSDKKVSGGNVYYTLLQSLGNGFPGVRVSPPQVLDVLKK
jgi:3-dehydroquinate synthase